MRSIASNSIKGFASEASVHIAPDASADQGCTGSVGGRPDPNLYNLDEEEEEEGDDNGEEEADGEEEDDYCSDCDEE